MNDVLRQELDDLHARGLKRSLRTLTSPQGRVFAIDGREVLNFCSNDYLGIAADPRLSAAASKAMARVGFGAGAARLVCGNFDEHMALEQELAAHKATEAALVFGCGYMANAGIISSLAGRGDAVFADRLNHASILDGITLSRAKLYRYPHKDMGALDEMLRQADSARRKLIVTDTVFSMDGDVAPLKELAGLAERYDAWLMADEAHAFGVLGPSGAGLVEALGLGGRVPVQMGTLSKAAGSYGAYVAGDALLKDFLINTARSFIFTTALPPGVVAASRAALRIIREEPDRRVRLMDNAEHMRQALRSAGFDTRESVTPIIPVMVGDADRAVDISTRLLARGIFAAAIRPPAVEAGAARLRVTVTAAHTPEDIDACVEALKHVW